MVSGVSVADGGARRKVTKQKAQVQPPADISRLEKRPGLTSVTTRFLPLTAPGRLARLFGRGVSGRPTACCLHEWAHKAPLCGDNVPFGARMSLACSQLLQMFAGRTKPPRLRLERNTDGW
jgi:hypothetical protein